MNSIEYRPEIDGIRALAVVSVLFFHVEFAGFAGGFLGVDIFFVISGYLITRIIYDKSIRKEFRFRTFYTRRIKRLFPAHIFVLSCVFIASYFYLSPFHFERTSGAILASIFSISNFYFWNEAGYFDPSAELKPLLHTWSLSVEEQFYLIWPILIFLLGKFHTVPKRLIISVSYTHLTLPTILLV